jgi:hypothetical protein
MTNREAHEEAAGMNLDPGFFQLNHIDPDAEYVAPIIQDDVEREKEFRVPFRPH